MAIQGRWALETPQKVYSGVRRGRARLEGAQSVPHIIGFGQRLYTRVSISIRNMVSSITAKCYIDYSSGWRKIGRAYFIDGSVMHADNDGHTAQATGSAWWPVHSSDQYRCV